MTKNNECGSGEATGGALYFFGMIGAAIHYIGQASGFWQGTLGLLKALVWPVFVVMKILGL